MCHRKPFAGIPILYGVRLIATIAILWSVGLTGHHLAQSSTRGVSVLPLGSHWTRELPFGESLRLVLGDTRLLLTSASRIDAVAWPTGELSWTSDLVATVPPVIGDGRVFVAADDALHALSEVTGHVEWRVAMGGISIPVVYRGGWLLVVGGDGRLRGLRASDGVVLWQTPALEAPWAQPPVVDGDHVFGSTTDGRLTAWRIQDGGTVWSVAAPATPLATLAAHGQVYVVTPGRLTAYQQRSGDRRWSYQTEMPIVSRLAADQTHVYLAALDNSVRAHRASNGHMVWNRKIDARVVDGLTADGGMVLVPHSDGRIRFIRAPNGQRAGELAAPGTDARGTTTITTSGYGPTLRVARLTVSDTTRTVETFARQTLPLTAATSLSGTPVSLTPPSGPPRP